MFPSVSSSVLVAPALDKSKVWLSGSAEPSIVRSSSPGVTLSIVIAPRMSDKVPNPRSTVSNPPGPRWQASCLAFVAGTLTALAPCPYSESSEWTGRRG